MPADAWGYLAGTAGEQGVVFRPWGGSASIPDDAGTRMRDLPGAYLDPGLRSGPDTQSLKLEIDWDAHKATVSVGDEKPLRFVLEGDTWRPASDR